MASVNNETLVTLTADIAAAFVSNNRVPTSGVGEVISSVHAALRSLGQKAEKEADAKNEPAVSVRASVKPDYIVCLEDGKKLKMLKRHLMTHYQMTPAEYREKWNLKADYPMVAPNYAATRKALALKSGLGRKPAVAPAPAAAPVSAAKPKRKTLKAALGEPKAEAPKAEAVKASKASASKASAPKASAPKPSAPKPAPRRRTRKTSAS